MGKYRHSKDELELLLSLIRSHLCDSPVDDCTAGRLHRLNETGWMSLLELAEMQTVSGLLYKAAEKFPGDVSVSEDVFMSLMTKVNRIVNRNVKLRNVESSVLGILSSVGCHPVIKKGSTCAARYPFPELRESGDIDIYLQPEEFQKGREAVEASCGGGSERPDSSVLITIYGCNVELHRMYYDLHAEVSCLPGVPGPEAEMVMLSSHILKHASGVGVGLRQVCDFALAYHGYQGDRNELKVLFRSIGLEKWHRLLLSFIQEYIDPSVEVDKVSPRPLFRIILRGGNFGHYATSRSGSLERRPAARKADTALRLLGRLPFALRYAKNEALASIKGLIKGNL